MSDSANTTIPHVDETMTNPTPAGLADAGKGKGKAVDPVGDVEMADDDDSEEDEEEVGDGEDDGDEEEEEEDNLEEIDPDNIVEGGRRTRGRVIDFAKAAAEAKDLDHDEDEDEDEDFEAPDEEMQH